MKKIIHLSDLHVGHADLGSRVRHIVREIRFWKEPASNYVVVITGDLVEDATQFDPYSAVRRQIQNLTDFGFGVLVCPGNHDYGTGSFGHKRYVGEFKQAFFGTTAVQYPKLDVIDGCAFIGLDTMAEELGFFDRLFAEGEIGKDQLERLDAMLSNGQVTGAAHRVVYMHHHPFDPQPFHNLKDSDELGEVLQNRGVGTLLYGHNHEGRVANGKWGIPRCFDGGTATGKRNGVIVHRVFDPAGPAGEFYDGKFLTGYTGEPIAGVTGVPGPVGVTATSVLPAAAMVV